MKHSENTQEKPQNIKRKLMSALAMLLIATILMTTTSYAWFIMATAPEVTGITTSVGANGSLEIALLNTDTWMDPTTIKTTFRGSLQKGVTSANYTWGNLVDLSNTSFGLNSINLLPSRLHISDREGSYFVEGGMLSVPEYGYDGRIIGLHNNTLSATYNSKEFAYITGIQNYGVRAIGTNDTLSAQAVALTAAKTNVIASKASAANTAAAALSANGVGLFDILFLHATDATATFDDDDVRVIQSMKDGLQNALNTIKTALRQGLIAYAAADIQDETIFNAALKEINNATNLSDLDGKENIPFPSEFRTWISALDDMQNDLNTVNNVCTALVDGSYTWEEIRTPLSYLINSESTNVYIGLTTDLQNAYNLSELNKDIAMDFVGEDVTLTLGPGSGIFADIADFTDDYIGSFTAMAMNIMTTTKTLQNPVYLDTLYVAVNRLEPADNTSTGKSLSLTTTYGYALDLAFRTNAAGSNLLLQTSPEQRIYSDSTASGTMGGGSYMEFSATDKALTLKQITALMDAMRVGFTDSMGNLLGVAKLNISNRVVDGDYIKAPLYLYDFTISEDPDSEGAMIMGERQKDSNVLTSLDQYTAKAVTVIVWLDGDLVDNSMVTGEESTSISGKLNLQFASSANLKPVGNSGLMTVSTDKADLTSNLNQAKVIYTNGQFGQMKDNIPVGYITTPSWNNFIAKYERAQAIAANGAATQSQIYQANYELDNAVNDLETADTATLAAKIEELRQTMGTIAGQTARIVLKGNDGLYYSLDTYTESQNNQKVGTIASVDYSLNHYDQGNGVLVPKYSPASWEKLADALYDAETVLFGAQDKQVLDTQIDEVLIAIEKAENSLERESFFVPYIYNGTIYYALEHLGVDYDDTYVKWYYNDFTHVTSDLMILNLDADAEPVEIAELVQSDYIAMNGDDTIKITPYINIFDEMYAELEGEEIIAAHWELDAFFTRLMSPYQKTYIQSMIDDPRLTDTTLKTAAISLIADESTSYSAAGDMIRDLEAKIAEYTAPGLTDNDPMTASEEYLLNKAIETAQKAEKYDTLTELKAAVTAAQAALANSSTTIGQANSALDALNTQLVANKLSAVTAATDLPIYLPNSYETYSPVYAADKDYIALIPGNDVGTGTITVYGLTENGVILKFTKEITVYEKAEGIAFNDNSISISTGGSDAWIDLIYADNGYPAIGEDIKSCTWASSNTRVATVTGDNSGNCSITGVASGSTTITVTVKTEQGNTYYASISVTVNW